MGLGEALEEMHRVNERRRRARADWVCKSLEIECILALAPDRRTAANEITKMFLGEFPE